MKRRTFIKTGLSAGLATGLLIHPLINMSGGFNNLPDSIIIKGKTPRERFIQGIKTLGGITQFVKKGDKVVIKPSMAYNQLPGTGYNSDPLLIKEIIDQCYLAKARTVSVFDHTVDPWTKCYKNSGIERTAKDAMARVWPANNEMYYTEMKSDKAKILKSVKIHNALLEADVFINVAELNMNRPPGFSGAFGNLIGCIWDKTFFENNGYDQCLSELLFYLKPDLNIVDGVKVNSEENPFNQVLNSYQVMAKNIVETDSIAVQLLRANFKDYGYLKNADELGFGSSLVDILNIRHVQ